MIRKEEVGGIWLVGSIEEVRDERRRTKAVKLMEERADKCSKIDAMQPDRMQNELRDSEKHVGERDGGSDELLHQRPVLHQCYCALR